MGTHTWCYKRLKKVDYDELEKKLIKDFDKNIKLANDKIIIEEDEVEKNIWKEYLEYAKGISELLNNNKVSEQELEDLFMDSSTDEVIIDGYYFISTEFHDPFRISYKEDILKSKEETMEFIEKYNTSICSLYNTSIDEFWNKYPDGVICFG